MSSTLSKRGGWGGDMLSQLLELSTGNAGQEAYELTFTLLHSPSTFVFSFVLRLAAGQNCTQYTCRSV